MDKSIKKAKTLFGKGKIEQSLSIYERVIHKRFKVYPKELVEYLWNTHKSVKKSDNEENINQVVNIQTNPGQEENKAEIEMFKQNEISFNKPTLSIIKSEDLRLLSMVVIEFNKIGMQYLSQGKIEEARLILKKLVKMCKSYAKQDLKLI